MLERTHTMQNAGGTVAVIAIVHVVCMCVCVWIVYVWVCAHGACVYSNYTDIVILIANMVLF